MERAAGRRSTGLRYSAAAILLIALALTWTDFALRVFLPAVTAPHWTNPSYWVAARLAVEGNTGIIYGDQTLFLQETARLGAVPDTFQANMPTALLVVWPLAAFNETTARALVDVVMVAAYIAALAMLMRILSLPPFVTLGLWVAAPLFHPWRENTSRGQVYTLLLALLVLSALLGFDLHVRGWGLGARGWPRNLQAFPEGSRRDATGAGSAGERKPWMELIAGAALGLVVVIKAYYGLVLLVPMPVLRRGRLLLASAGVVATAVGLTLALWGGDIWVKALGDALTWRDRPETGVTAYQTVNSWLSHLFRYDATFNPRPVANLPEVVSWGWRIAALAIGGITLLALWKEREKSTRSNSRSMLAPALMVPAALILSPVAEDYHFVLTLFPLVVGFVTLRDMYNASASAEGTGGGRLSAIYRRTGPAFLLGAAAWLLALVLLGAPWHFNVPGVVGWHALLYYPRLYGALILWTLIACLLAARPTTDDRQPTTDGSEA